MYKPYCCVCGADALEYKDGLPRCEKCGAIMLAGETRRAIEDVLFKKDARLTLPSSYVPPDKSEELIKKAKFELASGNFSKCAGYCDLILEYDKYDSRAWLIKGRATAQESDSHYVKIEEAAVFLYRAVDLAPQPEKEAVIREAVCALKKSAQSLMPLLGAYVNKFLYNALVSDYFCIQNLMQRGAVSSAMLELYERFPIAAADFAAAAQKDIMREYAHMVFKTASLAGRTFVEVNCGLPAHMADVNYRLFYRIYAVVKLMAMSAQICVNEDNISEMLEELRLFNRILGNISEKTVLKAKITEDSLNFKKNGDNVSLRQLSQMRIKNLESLNSGTLSYFREAIEIEDWCSGQIWDRERAKKSAADKPEKHAPAPSGEILSFERAYTDKRVKDNNRQITRIDKKLAALRRMTECAPFAPIRTELNASLADLKNKLKATGLFKRKRKKYYRAQIEDITGRLAEVDKKIADVQKARRGAVSARLTELERYRAELKREAAEIESRLKENKAQNI